MNATIERNAGQELNPTRLVVRAGYPGGRARYTQRADKALPENVPGRAVGATDRRARHAELYRERYPPSRSSGFALALEPGSCKRGDQSCDLQGSDCFPNARRPSVFWAGVKRADAARGGVTEATGSALSRLATAVERALVPVGIAAEKREFNPCYHAREI